MQREIIKYYPKISVAELKVLDNPVSIGETIHIIGKKTGLVRQTVKSMQVEKKDIQKAERGMVVGLKTEERVRPGDKVYLIKYIDMSDNINVNPQLF